MGRCLRVRVSIDITKKLIQGKKINIEGGENRCGMLNHAIKDCQEGSLVNGGNEEESLQYGAWLRGDPWKKYGGDMA
ncbi:hypothetical protein CFP56_012698 [Quercus suber]|uniref:Uncharacterized protein n=1 Tax=Quercus suber TaxID=58331 RepID=A0AAW0KUS2_QUESU